jgi:phosphinothricin acetyltransferase
MESIAQLTNIYIETTTIHFSTDPIPASHYLNHWQRDSPRFPWLIAEIDGAFVGYAKAGTWRDRTAYDQTAEVAVYVHPDHHRKGVARALYTELLNQLRTLGFHAAIAGLTLPNEASQRLHEALGFDFVATYKQVGRKFDKWHDVAFYQIML